MRRVRRAVSWAILGSAASHPTFALTRRSRTTATGHDRWKAAQAMVPVQDSRFSRPRVEPTTRVRKILRVGQVFVGARTRGTGNSEDPVGGRVSAARVARAARYRTSARASTTPNPKVIARIVDRTDPITEANPLTAHPHATYSRDESVRPATTPIPSGMNMPRHRPNGARTPSATGMRAARGQGSSASVNGVSPSK